MKKSWNKITLHVDRLFNIMIIFIIMIMFIIRLIVHLFDIFFCFLAALLN